jgi:hypothetical protein
MRGISRPTLYDINRTLTSAVIPTLLPKYSPLLQRRITLSEELLSLTSHPGYRFLDVKITPQTSLASIDFTCDQWSTLLSTIERMNHLGKYTERGLGSSHSSTDREDPTHLMKSVASSLTLFGPDSGEAIQQLSSASPSLSVSSPGAMTGVTSWSSSPPALYSSPLSVNGYYRSCCLVSNSQSILPSLSRPVQQGASMFSSGAYTHQYLSCGLELEDFVSSFRSLGQIIQNYKSL